MLFQVVLPKVVALLKRSAVVKLITLLAEQCIAHVRGVGRQAHHSIQAVVEVELERLNGLISLLVVLFIGILFIGVGIVVNERCLLLAEAELVVGLAVEEHDVDVSLSAPAAMTAEARPIGAPDHGLAIEHPLGIAIGIAALGQVGSIRLR